MKKNKLLIALLSASMVLTAGAALAGCTDPTPTPGPDTDIEQPQHTAPVITIEAGTEEIEIYQGDDFEILFGVSAKDDAGNTVAVIVSNDGGFDIDTVGEYTVEYSATANGLTSKKTRTIKVLQELAPITLEARTDKFNKPVWESKEKLNFKNKEYHELTASETFSVQSGIFYNKSNAEITVSVDGTYGVAAIINENGVVIEGRDGTNNNLVNEANPARATSSAKTMNIGGEDKDISAVFAQEMKIPAGGWAIVVQNGYVGTTADTDGRGYMNYNIIGEYGNVVRLYWTDAAEGEYLTEYVNQKPTVSGNSEIIADEADGTFDLATAVKAGLVIKDDNGTFEASDDTTITEVTITDNGNFDINTVGDYVITLTATDGTLTTEFTRKVKVVANADAITVAFNNKTIKFLNTGLAVDQDLSAVGSYNLIVYTYAYKAEHETLGFSTGYGGAYVVDKYGKIVRTYDGANGRYSDATHNDVSDAELCAAATYAAQAYESLQEGETVFIAPHNTSNGNSSDGGTRQTFVQLANRTAIGADFACTGFEFEEKPYVITIGEGDGAKTLTAVESKYAYNEVVSKPAEKYMIVYTKAYTETLDLSGYKYGAAIVLDKYGKLVKVYDGANAGVYDETGKIATPTDFKADTYATYAWENLGADETLIIFPNDGTSGATAVQVARSFALGLRTDGSIGKYVTFTDMVFADPDAEPAAETTLALGQNNITIETENIALNPTAAGAQLYVYNTAFSGKIPAGGYGVALVISDGKVVRVYDGISAKYFDTETPAGTQENVGFTANTYLEAAVSSLKGGEYLLAAPNVSGSLATDPVRTFFNSNRTVNAEVTLTGYTVTTDAKDMAKLTVNGKTFFNPVVANNIEVTNVANYDFAIYSYGYNGIPLKNGWSEAFVIGADGKVVKIYDGVNNRYYDAQNTAGAANKIAATDTTAEQSDIYYKLAETSLEAFLKLNPGETLLIGLNGGMQSNRGRAFLVDNRTLGTDVVFSGITVPAAATTEVKYMKLTVGTKVWYQDVTTVANNAAYSGTPAFAIYDYGYDGTKISNSYGVAFIIDKTTNKVVKIYDGASGKYWDAENNGVSGTCTAAGYVNEAFTALEEGQYVLIAPNGGSTGNVARGLLYGNRTLDIGVTYELPAEAQA